jgi:hypothetical protein
VRRAISLARLPRNGQQILTEWRLPDSFELRQPGYNPTVVDPNVGRPEGSAAQNCACEEPAHNARKIEVAKRFQKEAVSSELACQSRFGVAPVVPKILVQHSVQKREGRNEYDDPAPWSKARERRSQEPGVIGDMFHHVNRD